MSSTPASEDGWLPIAYGLPGSSARLLCKRLNTHGSGSWARSWHHQPPMGRPPPAYRSGLRREGRWPRCRPAEPTWKRSSRNYVPPLRPVTGERRSRLRRGSKTSASTTPRSAERIKPCGIPSGADSSAVVPLLVVESSSAAVMQEYESDPEVVAWWATEAECVSALARLEREGSLTAPSMGEGLRRLDCSEAASESATSRTPLAHEIWASLGFVLDAQKGTRRGCDGLRGYRTASGGRRAGLRCCSRDLEGRETDIRTVGLTTQVPRSALSLPPEKRA